MRLTAAALGLMILPLALGAQPAVAARVSAQSAHCADSAKREGLTGSKRTAFVRTCMKGPLTPAKPTTPTEANKESSAVTRPSGADRTTRAKQCAAEAERKGLAAKERSAFQLSCLATAGPVSEGETGTTSPHPANAIKGIGVNNYNQSNKAAASKPAPPKP